MKNLIKKEPLALIGVIGAILTFLLQNWDLLEQLLARVGLAPDILTLIGMFLTILVGRQFVTPVK